MANHPTPEVLRRLLRYDPETGKLFWLARDPEMISPGRNGRTIEADRWNRRHAGKEALCHRHHSGYLSGAVLGRSVTAHRVAWAIWHGEWPGQIDHINGDRSDNRIANLRAVTPSENAKNCRVRRDNSSGRVGVYLRPNLRWQASIRVNGRIRGLGCFATFEEAAAARSAAEKQHDFHPNHGRRA